MNSIFGCLLFCVMNGYSYGFLFGMDFYDFVEVLMYGK